MGLSDGLKAGVGDVILTRRNDAKLVTSNGDVVRNGQRWVVDSIGKDGSITARRCDDDLATVTLNRDIDGRALGTMTSSGVAQLGVFIEVVTV